MERRSFLRGLVGLIAAPAVVCAASIMPVRVPLVVPTWEHSFRLDVVYGRARVSQSFIDAVAEIRRLHPWPGVRLAA